MKKILLLLITVSSLSAVAQEKWNLNVRPRVNFSNASFKNTITNYSSKLNADAAFGLGVEVESVLNINKNKWALTLEPTYHYAKAEETVDHDGYVGGKLTSVLDYKVLELPLGVRHYMFLNENSKLHLDAQFSVNFNLDSHLTRKRADGSEISSLKLKNKSNFALGFGYKYKNKYGAQLKYSFARNIMSEYVYWDAKYNTLSFILSYNLL